MLSWWSLSVEQTLVLSGIPMLGGAVGRSVAWLLLRRDSGGTSLRTSSLQEGPAYVGDRGIASSLKRMDDEVLAGKRSPESLALMPREMVRRARIARRADARDEGSDYW